MQALEAKAEVAKAMDSDGFVMVKRSAAGAGAGAAPAFESDNVRRKKKRGGIVVQDFYKFQRQESKLDREWLRAAACRCRGAIADLGCGCTAGRRAVRGSDLLLPWTRLTRHSSLSNNTAPVSSRSPLLQALRSCEPSSKRTRAASSG
jgi:hypothetical protein